MAENQSLSITGILTIAKSYFYELLKKSWIILIIAGAVGYYFWQKRAAEPTTYTARLSFMFNEEQSNISSLAFLGGLGDLGGGASGTSNVKRILELMDSRKIASLTLLRKSEINEEQDYLVNHYIDEMGMRDAWKEQKKEDLLDFRFEHDSIATFTRLENSIFNSIYGRIRDVHLQKRVSEANIIHLSFNGTSESFAYLFLNEFYDALNEYYTEQSIRKQLANFDAAQERADSLAEQLEKAEGRLSGFVNRNQFSSATYSQSEIQLYRLQSELSAVTQTYLNAVRSQETARFILERQAPAMELIDPPVYPLPANSSNPFMGAVIGVLVGGFLGVILVLGRKVVLDLLRSEKEKEAQQEMEQETASSDTA